MNISEVKRSLGRRVKYNGSEYLFTGCILRKSENGLYYQSELQDLKANRSIIICRLTEIEIKEESQ